MQLRDDVSGFNSYIESQTHIHIIEKYERMNTSNQVNSMLSDLIITNSDGQAKQEKQ